MSTSKHSGSFPPNNRPLLTMIDSCLLQHVVFGKVVDGMDVVKAIEAVGSQSGKPRAEVKIASSGQL